MSGIAWHAPTFMWLYEATEYSFGVLYLRIYNSAGTKIGNLSTIAKLP